MPEAKRHSAGSRRDDVLAAAIVEFGAGGLDGTSAEAIAVRAGISQPYVFRLFGTKKALFLAAYERCCDDVLHAFRRAAGEAASDDPQERLSAMGKAYVALLADRDRLQLQLQAYTACADPEVREAVRRRYGELYLAVRDLTGAEPESLRRLFATGMLLNVAAAMDLGAIAGHTPWAQDLLGPSFPALAR
jgi:AcrR family transcriptional regulator